jgi:hypothetical protein
LTSLNNFWWGCCVGREERPGANTGETSVMRRREVWKGRA